ncbi:MAG: DUF4383 domain-containing protein [Solirubrobacteraceae bacterium]
MRGGDIARPFALIVGVAYLAVGIIGFTVTGFTGVVSSHNGELLGFGLNVFHNLFHVIVGGAFIVASRLRDATITQGILIGGGAVYIVAALLGFLPGDRLSILTIHGTFAPDNFLHLVSGALAVIVGLVSAVRAPVPDLAY